MLSPTGKRVSWLLALAWAASAAPAAAAVQPLWQQTFDQQLPGQAPAGWSVSWGNPGDDLLVVSNLRATSGARSLLLDRQTGEQSPMAGYVTRFPGAKSGWLAFAVAFLAQGTADAFHIGFEWRGANPGEHVAQIGLDGRSAVLTSADRRAKAELGDFVEDGWYRLRLWLPATAGGETLACLERRTPDGAWQRCGELGRVPGTVAASGLGTFMVVTPPGKRGFLLFLDDLSAETVAAEALPR